MIAVSFMRMYQYKNGFYYVAFQGNQRRSLKTKDKTIADRLFKRLRREVLNKNILLLDKNKNINLDDFIKEYLEYSKAHKAQSTYVRDRYSLRLLREHLGNVLLKSITSENLDKFHTDLINSGKKKSGVNITIRHLKSVFNKAIDWDYIKVSPYSRCTQIKEKKRQPKFYSEDELKRIFHAIKEDQDFFDLITVYLLSGMRRSELAFLDKKDIDIKNNIVTIRNSKRDGRVMPIYGAMEEIFKRRCNGVGRVFPNWKPDSIGHRWIRLMKRLGIKGRLHDLRHSTASYLVLAGEGIRTIQKILGHTDISTTMIYSHLTQDHMRKALSSLDKLHKNSITENLKIVTDCK